MGIFKKPRFNFPWSVMDVKNLQDVIDAIIFKFSGNVDFFDLGGQLGDTSTGGKTETTSGYYKCIHDDGSYTMMSADGVKRYTAIDNKDYHYLNYVGSAESTGTPTEIWIQLPDEFKNKSFVVGLSIKDLVYNGYELTDWVANIKLYPVSYDYPNGKFSVIGYWIASNGTQIDDKPLEFTYMVTA